MQSGGRDDGWMGMSIVKATTPRIWVLVSQKPGDNNQSIALATAIGLPYLVKRLDWPADEGGEKRLCDALLADTVEAGYARRRLGIAKPWPDAMICCGRRGERFALWIKRQADGKSKIFKIGRASYSLEHYDLLIATPQFPVPPLSNVVSLRFPPVREGEGSTIELSKAGGIKDVLSSFSKPWFAILVGGEVRHFSPSARRLRGVAHKIQSAADLSGGSVLISTSRRTPPEMLSAITSGLTGMQYLYCWSPQDAEMNPYLTLLRKSAAVFVTADSVSMMMDASRLGTPTFIIELPQRFSRRALWELCFHRTLMSAAAWAGRHGGTEIAHRLYLFLDWMHARRFARFPKDISRLHEALYASGLARPASEFDPSVVPARSEFRRIGVRELEDAAARCRDLLAPLQAGAPALSSGVAECIIPSSA